MKLILIGLVLITSGCTQKFESFMARQREFNSAVVKANNILAEKVTKLEATSLPKSKGQVSAK